MESFIYISNIGKVKHNRNFKLIQLNKNGEVIELWDNTREAANYFNCKISNITRCCSGERKTYKCFIWRFEKDFDKNEIFDLKIKKSKKHTSIQQIDKDNQLIKVWDDVVEICRKLNYNNSAIYQCLLGNRKTHKGYYWKLVS